LRSGRAPMFLTRSRPPWSLASSNKQSYCDVRFGSTSARRNLPGRHLTARAAIGHECRSRCPQGCRTVVAGGLPELWTRSLILTPAAFG
jgi:hypothetical protein